MANLHHSDRNNNNCGRLIMNSEKVTVKQAVKRLSEVNKNKNTPLPDLEGANYIHITPTPSSRKFYNSTM